MSDTTEPVTQATRLARRIATDELTVALTHMAAAADFYGRAGELATATLLGENVDTLTRMLAVYVELVAAGDRSRHDLDTFLGRLDVPRYVAGDPL